MSANAGAQDAVHQSTMARKASSIAIFAAIAILMFLALHGAFPQQPLPQQYAQTPGVQQQSPNHVALAAEPQFKYDCPNSCFPNSGDCVYGQTCEFISDSNCNNGGFYECYPPRSTTYLVSSTTQRTTSQRVLFSSSSSTTSISSTTTVQPPQLYIIPNPAVVGDTVVLQGVASSSSDSIELQIQPPQSTGLSSCTIGPDTGSVTFQFDVVQSVPPGDYIITANDITSNALVSNTLVIQGPQQAPPNLPFLSLSSNSVQEGTDVYITATGNPSSDTVNVYISGPGFSLSLPGTLVASSSPPSSPLASYTFNGQNVPGRYTVTAIDEATSNQVSSTLTVLAPVVTPPSLPQTNLLFRPQTWYGVAIIAVLVVIMIAAMVYALAGVIASSAAKAWARIQIYEALLSMVMLILFIAFSYMFFLNPQGAYASVGLLPNACSTGSVNTLFNLSSCDLGTFTQGAYSYFASLVYAGFIVSMSPGLSVLLELPTQIGISFSTELSSIIPGGVAGMVGTIMSVLLIALVLNHVQLILLSASLLFLSLFVTLGIIARTFGFTRTFGGAMIALGLGLGLVYPMLVSITYGFIAANAPSSSIVAEVGSGINILLGFVFGQGVNGAFFQGSQLNYLLGLGYVAVGLTFVPFLNFIILDAFIVDFSKAVGERIDFMSLMTGLV